MLYGMREDLKLKGNQFQVAVSILFVTYLVSFQARIVGVLVLDDVVVVI